MDNSLVLCAWSSGKDSAMALYQLQRSCSYKVSALLTTVTRDYDRVSIHGIEDKLLEAQAACLGIPIEKVYIDKDSSNEQYEQRMKDKLLFYKDRGVNLVVFGDIFLEDLRKYRQDNLSKVGMKAIFPIWGEDTANLAREIIDLGFKAVIVCADSKILDKTFVGAMFDEEFLSRLPSGVDPCGENGEFHTFLIGAPMFKNRIEFGKTKAVLKNNYWFLDIKSYKIV